MYKIDNLRDNDAQLNILGTSKNGLIGGRGLNIFSVEEAVRYSLKRNDRLIGGFDFDVGL